MSTRHILLAAGALTLALAATVFLVQPTVPSGAQAQPAAPAQPSPDALEAAPAVADLAARLGVEPGEIAVESVQAETWPDASLGLPEPGMMYAQVVTSGHVVTLSCAGRTYVYHVAGDVAMLAP